MRTPGLLETAYHDIPVSFDKKRLDIMTQFLIEAIMISMVGGVIGVAIGVGSSFIIRNVLNWPIVITTSSIVLSFAVCTFTGVFFGWYPAKKAANLDPIDAIRYE